MAKFTITTQVDAEQFVITAEQKAATKQGQVFDVNGIQIRKGGDAFGGLVNIGGVLVSLEEGDYVIKENGKVVKAVAKAQFEAAYKEVKEPKKG